MSANTRPDTDESPSLHGLPSKREAAVKQLIYNRAGRDSAIRSKDIARLLPHFDDEDASTVRDVIQQLVADGCLIGSCNRGYYRIDDHDEFVDEVESLLSTADTIRERARTLAAEWHRLQRRPADGVVKTDD